METNTFYYTLSTIPQVLAATTAILGAFMHYRLSSLRELLIGDGKSALNRLGDPGYKLDETYTKRLKDAIDRKNISEIKEVMKRLRDIEVDIDKKTLSERPKGLRFLYEKRFYRTNNYRKLIKKLTGWIIGISLLTIIFSVIFLSMTDCIFQKGYQYCIQNCNLVLFVISLLSTFALVVASLTEQTTYENLKKRDEIIKNNKKGEN